MENIWKKITRKSLKFNLLLGFFILILGVVILAYEIPNTSRYLLASKDFQVAVDDVIYSDKEFYTCNNNALIDWYGYNDKGYFYITELTDSTGYVRYMGFYVPNEYINTARQIAQEVDDYYNGGDIPTTTIKGRGFIRDMDEAEKGFVNEYFTGAPESVTSRIVYKTFIYVPYKDVFNFPVVLFLVLGACLFICSLFFLMNALFGIYSLELKSFLNTRNISREQFTEDMLDSITFSGDKYYCGKEYMVIASYMINPIEYKDILMVKPGILNTQHTSYGVPTGTTVTYRVFLTLRDKDKPKILQVSSWQEALCMCRYIHEMNPQVRFVDPEGNQE